MQALRFIFAGGGTGGHLFPALAIARGLEERLGGYECDIRFVGTRNGLEYRLRDTIGYPLEIIPVRGFARSFNLKNLLFPFALLGAMIKSQSLLNRVHPHLVVGCGGYVSGPIVSRAVSRGIPSVIQEQNSFPGFTTRKLAGRVERVYLGFDDAIKFLPATADVVVTGNPVRKDIGLASRSEGLREFGLDPNLKTILIIGGSQGARSINNAALENIDKLLEGIQLLWQTGKSDYERINVSTRRCNCLERIHLVPFTNRMELAYAAADIAIARAGALTLAELEVSRTPSLLVPYPHAAGDHQTHNARSYAKAGGALVIADGELGSEDIISLASEMLSSGKAHEMMGKLEKRVSVRGADSLELIVEDIVKLLDAKGILS